jgi:hypothetical protein
VGATFALTKDGPELVGVGPTLAEDEVATEGVGMVTGKTLVDKTGTVTYPDVLAVYEYVLLPVVTAVVVGQ